MDRKPIDIVAILTEGLRYWEKKRLVFNIVVTAVFLLNRRWSLAAEQPMFFLSALVIWVLLGTLANALYCVCYFPEIAFQISDLRGVWREYRWGLFTLLTVVGSIFAWLIPKMYGF